VSRGLGAALASELLERGFTVVGIGRGSNPALTGERYVFVQFDLAETAGIDAVLGPSLEALEERQPASVCLGQECGKRRCGWDLRAAYGKRNRRRACAGGAREPVLPCLCRCGNATAGDQRLLGRGADGAVGEAVYCVAKAGIEMLTLTLAADQQAPNFRAITVRPGVMDTEMQLLARSQPPDILPSVELFKEFHHAGRLVAPAVVASKIASRLVVSDVEHGRTYSYQDPLRRKAAPTVIRTFEAESRARAPHSGAGG
jgi:benzil reductase ((S)-benzoin forming)